MSELRTPRLRLQPSAPVLAAAVAAFYARNAEHLAPWEPRRARLDDPATQALALIQQAERTAAGEGWRWWLQGADDGPQVIGAVALNNPVRGYHHSANLGYALDAAAQGHGLMQEALQAVIAHAFGALNLHRLQAGCLPVNARSIALLQRLGFREIGLARDYLCIAGRWQDHRLFERLNPDFRAPSDWA